MEIGAEQDDYQLDQENSTAQHQAQGLVAR